MCAVKGSGRARYPLDPLVDIMDRLLGPDGCPWDREQTHRSLRPYVVEEAYEVVAAIDSGDPDKLKDELGDLLLQVVFHAALARREGRFDLNDVVAAITSKLLRRHPHVFGGGRPGRSVNSSGEVLRQWEDIKREEAADQVRLEAHLPALMQAQKLLERAARLGVDAPPETSGQGLEAEFGRRLLALLEQARQKGVDAELALRNACAALARRLDDR